MELKWLDVAPYRCKLALAAPLFEAMARAS
jgi:hypothetical protein